MVLVLVSHGAAGNAEAVMADFLALVFYLSALWRAGYIETASCLLTVLMVAAGSLVAAVDKGRLYLKD